MSSVRYGKNKKMFLMRTKQVPNAPYSSQTPFGISGTTSKPQFAG